MHQGANSARKLTVDLVPGLDAWDRDDSLVYAEVGVRDGRDRLCLPRSAARERWVVEVEHPCICLQWDVRAAAHPTGELWTETEERAEDDVRSRER